MYVPLTIQRYQGGKGSECNCGDPKTGCTVGSRVSHLTGLTRIRRSRIRYGRSVFLLIMHFVQFVLRQTWTGSLASGLVKVVSLVALAALVRYSPGLGDSVLCGWMTCRLP